MTLLLRNGRKGLDSQSNVLFPLETINAEYDLFAFKGLAVVILAQLLLVVASIHTGIDNLHIDIVLQARPGPLHNALGEARIDGYGLGKPHAPLLEGVKGHAVEALYGGVAALGEQEIGEVAVEQDGGRRVQVLQKGQAGGELVDEKGARPQSSELAGEVNSEQKVNVSSNGAENGQAREDGHGDEPVAADSNIKSAFLIRVREFLPQANRYLCMRAIAYHRDTRQSSVWGRSGW